MAKRKRSASLLAAQASFFSENNIYIEKKTKTGGVNTPVKRALSDIIASEMGINGSIKDFGIYIRGINKSPKLIRMSDREIIEILIYEYQKAFDYISNEEISCIKNFLVSNWMQLGICNFSRNKIGVSINNKRWVEVNCAGNSSLWYSAPISLDSKDDIIYSIKFRLDKLKEILENESYND